MIIIVIIIIKSSLKFKKGNALSSESKNTTIQFYKVKVLSRKLHIYSSSNF